MISLTAKTREKFGKKARLAGDSVIPAVLYGPKIKNQSIEVNAKEFSHIHKEAGESSLVSLVVDGKKFSVLIHDTQLDPISGNFTHIDFYQPILTEEVVVNIPVAFEGEAPAVKDLGGTLVKGFQEIEIKALPENLPHQITVNVESLKSFEDVILIKNLALPEKVKTTNDPEAIIASVLPPVKVEEELEKPIEEKVEDVEAAGKEEKVKEEAETEETQAQEESKPEAK